MEVSSTVHSAVNKASRVSKRTGKWANIQEIKSKIPHVTAFKKPVRPILDKLVKNSNIEKKTRVALWRPDDSGALASNSSKKRSSKGADSGRRKGGSRRSERKTGDRRTGRKASGRIARTVAAGAVGGAVRGSINSTIRQVML